jgi:RNA polymerase sigma factor (TIGR02999 family)
MEMSSHDHAPHDDVHRPPARAELDDVLPLVYEELRRAAHRQLSASAAESLCTTALVHELYLKLATAEPARWTSRAHFMAIAAVAMRYILVDRARRRAAEKRGGDRAQVTLDDELIEVERQADSLVELDDALTDLSRVDARLAQVVEMRFFGGMTESETAAVLGVTERTVRRDWTKARGLLHQALAD